MAAKYLQIPAAALSRGFSINYQINVPAGKLWTTGTVEKIRRVGSRTVEITLKHRKTGQVHVNRLNIKDTVYLFAEFLQPGYAEQMAADPMAELIGGIETCKEWVDSLNRQLQGQLKTNVTAFFATPVEK